MDSAANMSKGYKYYDSVRKNGVQYKIGDCCYVQPDAFHFVIKPDKPPKVKTDRKVWDTWLCVSFLKEVCD